MPLTRTGHADVNIQRQVFAFAMLNGDIRTRFTIGFSVVRDLDQREVMPRQMLDQFERQRDKIEGIAQHIFFSRKPQTNEPVALTRENFFG